MDVVFGVGLWACGKQLEKGGGSFDLENASQ